MLPKLRGQGLKCGEDFFLAYSPEREDPGRKDHNTQTIPKVVGGIDPVSGELATALYRKAIKQVVPVSSAEVAEAAKILENTYRAVNIALVNELKVVLHGDGHRRVGSDRRGRDQAVRLPGVLPRPGPGRALHPDRPVLPDVGGPRGTGTPRGSSSWPARSTGRCRTTSSTARCRR